MHISYLTPDTTCYVKNLIYKLHFQVLAVNLQPLLKVAWYFLKKDVLVENTVLPEDTIFLLTSAFLQANRNTILYPLNPFLLHCPKTSASCHNFTGTFHYPYSILVVVAHTPLHTVRNSV